MFPTTHLMHAAMRPMSLLPLLFLAAAVCCGVSSAEDDVCFPGGIWFSNNCAVLYGLPSTKCNRTKKNEIEAFVFKLVFSLANRLRRR